VRIEMISPLRTHHVKCLVERQCALIRPVVRDGVEDVGDRDDPPLERDLLGCKPSGIARSVEALMVGVRDRGGEIEEFGARPGEDLPAHRGVRFDQAPLVGAQGGGRACEDRVGKPDLADVVERCGQADKFRAGRLKAELGRDDGGRMRDPFYVGARVAITVLGRPRESSDRLLLSEANRAERPRKVFCPASDLLLEDSAPGPLREL
jgi:hypothetical protein